MKAFMFAALLAGCSLQEPNPRYLGACVDPAVEELQSQQLGLECPAEMAAWSVRTDGRCIYRDVCGRTWDVWGCSINAVPCVQAAPAGKASLIHAIEGGK